MEQQSYEYEHHLDLSSDVLFVKVMTDEQLELLRHQISIYAAICDRLVEMHKLLSAQQDHLTGVRLGMGMGNLYCDTLTSHKYTTRQRWNPTQAQLHILERIFDQGNGTPSKQEIKQLTAELSKHGQISETNVYNWFQNRRARSKRKQSAAVPISDANTEVAHKKAETTPASEQSSPGIQIISLHSGPEAPCINAIYDGVQPTILPLDCTLPSPCLSVSSEFEYFLGKVDIPGSNMSCWQEEDGML